MLGCVSPQVIAKLQELLTLTISGLKIRKESAGPCIEGGHVTEEGGCRRAVAEQSEQRAPLDFSFSDFDL